MSLTPKQIKFKDYPEFLPNLTPKQVIKYGAFNGQYFRPIYSSITNKNYKNQYKKYKSFDNVDINLLSNKMSDVSINKYKVKSGTSLEAWEESGWITKTDPYGWFAWYCAFYEGRRTNDDERQIKRWKGVMSRFKKRLINMLNKKNKKYNDFTVSPKIRQLLLHWGYEIIKKDM